MLKHLINFYKVSSPGPCNGDVMSSSGKRRLKYLQWSTFLSATFGYGMYYVCRLSLNVVKKPIVDEGIFSETELGIIGSVLFFTYAVGKFTNGFLANFPRTQTSRQRQKRQPFPGGVRGLLIAGLLATAMVFFMPVRLWQKVSHGNKKKKN